MWVPRLAIFLSNCVLAAACSSRVYCVLTLTVPGVTVRGTNGAIHARSHAPASRPQKSGRRAERREGRRCLAAPGRDLPAGDVDGQRPRLHLLQGPAEPLHARQRYAAARFGVDEPGAGGRPDRLRLLHRRARGEGAARRAGDHPDRTAAGQRRGEGDPAERRRLLGLDDEAAAARSATGTSSARSASRATSASASRPRSSCSGGRSTIR